LIEKFLEKNVSNFSHRTYLVYKMQLLLLLIIAGVFLKFLIPYELFLIAELILIVVLLYELATEGREEFREDFSAYLYFFVGLIIIAQLSWLGPVFAIDLSGMSFFFFALIILLFIFMAVFWIVFRRNYGFGKVVMSDGENCLVETEFDLRSWTVAKKHEIKSGVKFSKGERVKLRLKRGLFGPKPIEIEKI